MRINELSLTMEMSNLVISGPGEAKIIVWISVDKTTKSQHGKRVKVYGPNDTQGTVPWGSKKLPSGNLSPKTIETVNQFINTYQELLDAVWNSEIDYTQATKLYNLSKSKGLDVMFSELRKIINLT